MSGLKLLWHSSTSSSPVRMTSPDMYARASCTVPLSSLRLDFSLHGEPSAKVRSWSRAVYD
jgi:hypothetical protein